MKTSINFYSEKEGEIKRFLELFYSKNLKLENNLIYKQEFNNPIDMIEIISCFIDNNEKFNANLWISLDKDVYICVTNNNLNNIIKYIYDINSNTFLNIIFPIKLLLDHHLIMKLSYQHQKFLFQHEFLLLHIF